MPEIKYDPVKYKIGSRDNWNTVAHEYHNNWADQGIGPFASTVETVKLADIRQDNKVLDLACGTGAVSQQICKRLSSDGFLLGIDLSYVAISIARKSLPFPNVEFSVMDAENMSINHSFDRVLCQYALMFFPDATGVLKKTRSLMKNGGRISVAVHGDLAGVPYFSTIMEPILHYIPDIRPKDAPNVHRFGNIDSLGDALNRADFGDISIRKFVFHYEAGTFEQYWSDYLSSTANAILPAIEAAGAETVSLIKERARKRALDFTQNRKIIFPWDVLIATAVN